MNLSERIKKLAEQHFDDLVATRRHLHSHPELSFEEYETTKFIANKLQENGYDLQTITATGGYIDIKGKNPGSKIIALRGDIDALPIIEQNDVAYKSKNEGKMHACGHDGTVPPQSTVPSTYQRHHASAAQSPLLSSITATARATPLP